MSTPSFIPFWRADRYQEDNKPFLQNPSPVAPPRPRYPIKTYGVYHPFYADSDFTGPCILQYTAFFTIPLQVLPETAAEWTGMYDATAFGELNEAHMKAWRSQFAESDWKGFPIFDGDAVRGNTLSGIKVCRIAGAWTIVNDEDDGLFITLRDKQFNLADGDMVGAIALADAYQTMARNKIIRST